MIVPFVDLKDQYRTLKAEIDQAILRVIEETSFISGSYAARFEAEFAAYLDVANCVSCANGTDALEIALQAMGVRPGDEVIVPANTWISTAEAVTNIGGVPVFADIDERTYTLVPDEIARRRTAKTTAVIPVHLYGLPADMDRIITEARRFGLLVLEDCAQAHGAEYRGRRVGGFGDAATFSFYPSKNLGAFGDAGAIVTGRADIAERARLIANHGQSGKNVHAIEGRNSRLDGIQAAVLSAKLPHLDEWTGMRRRNASVYARRLEASGIPLPFEPDGSKHVFHLFVVRVENRDAVGTLLADAGVQTGIHYPKALPFVDAYSRFGARPEDYPVAHRQMGELLSLPMFPELSEEMIGFVCDRLLDAVKPSAAAV